MSSPYSILLLCIAAINLGIGVYAIRFYKSPGGVSYIFIMIALSLYSMGYAFELQALDLQEVQFWLHVEYLGISFLPPLFLTLASRYTGRALLLKSWLLVPLFALSLTTLFLEITNAGHLFYREIRLNDKVDFVLADFIKGPWYWVHQGYANIMIFASSILYVIMLWRSSGHIRKRALIMLLALTIPWCAYLIYIVGGSPYNIDLSPFSFSIAGILTALGIFRYNLLSYIPLAFEQVFNNMTLGVVVLDNEKHLVSCNASAMHILPDLASMSKGKSVERVFETIPSLAKLTDSLKTDIELSRMGYARHYHLQVVALKTERGRLKGWIVTLADITERKLKEYELLATENKLKELNTSKDKFFALIAHDLRNAFHLIINMSDMLVENLQQDINSPVHRKARVIYDTAVNTYSLLQNLLDWALMQSKGMSFKPEELLLHEMVAEEVRNLKTISDQKDLKIVNGIDSAIVIKGDQEMLKTVFRNLLSNAIKYSFSGGTIKVSATMQQDRVLIEVTDNGVGMSRDDQDKLFKLESYFSRKGTASENGTGLGLKLCKEFVRAHGSDIWVKSTLGQGSTFSFTVPLNPQSLQS